MYKYTGCGYTGSVNIHDAESHGSAVSIKSGDSNMVPLCYAYTTATTMFPFCLLPLQTVDLL